MTADEPRFRDCTLAAPGTVNHRMNMARRKDPTATGIVAIETVIVVDATSQPPTQIRGALVTTDNDDEPRYLIRFADFQSKPKVGRPKTRGVK
jgi:hypothetical protein